MPEPISRTRSPADSATCSKKIGVTDAVTASRFNQAVVQTRSFQRLRSNALTSVGVSRSRPGPDPGVGEALAGLGVEDVHAVGVDTQLDRLADLGPRPRYVLAHHDLVSPTWQTMWTSEPRSSTMLTVAPKVPSVSTESTSGRHPTTTSAGAGGLEPGRNGDGAGLHAHAVCAHGRIERAREQVHPRVADEPGHEDVRRVARRCPAGRPPAGGRPALITAIRSPIVIASTWSWVT